MIYMCVHIYVYICIYIYIHREREREIHICIYIYIYVILTCIPPAAPQDGLMASQGKPASMERAA